MKIIRIGANKKIKKYKNTKIQKYKNTGYENI